MTTSAAARMMLLLALAVGMAACSSGSDEGAAERFANDPANAPIAQVDEPAGGVVDGPIRGLLTVQPSFGFGVFEVDPTTGEARAVPGIASVETIDRNRDLLVSDGVAYALGAKTRPGQSFASDISVVRVDYETGKASHIAALGFDRETDDSPDLITHQLQAVAGDSVVVSRSTSGQDDGTYTVYDAATGDVRASFGTPFYEFVSEAGTCSGTVSNLVGLSDGRLAATALGSPAYIDLTTGEIELAIGCDQDEPQLASFVPVDRFDDFAVFPEGSAPTEDQMARLLETDLQPSHGFVEGDGDLWWIEADARQVDDVSVALGGVVQFDIETGMVEAVHALGDHLGEYIECDADSGCTLTTIAQADLRFFDGRLVIVDGRENGSVLTLDPTTGTVTETTIALGDGVDYTTAELLGGDPNGIWLEVGRFTITKDDETGRSASGPTYVERFDTVGSRIDLSLATQDLFF